MLPDVGVADIASGPCELLPSPSDPPGKEGETTMTAEQADWVTFEQRGFIGVITLNRPEKLNAFHVSMGEQIVAYLQSLNSGDYDTRCIILTGAGRAFCSGIDVSGMEQRARGEGQPPWRPFHGDLTHCPMAIRNCDVPVIGALNGYTIGGGLGLALATDLRIAGDDARFEVTQLKRGLFADYGLGHFLPQQIGQQRALELMLTGRMFGAEEALELGLVLKVVPKEQLLDSAFELAEQIASGPPLGIAASKRVAYMNDNDNLQRNLDWTHLGLGAIRGSDDAAEGIRSFFEKREPEFKGR